MKLHLDNNIVEGTPEELVEYLRLVGVESEKPSTDIKVGDRVKVLESESGAVGEATVTAVFENGKVELAGKSSKGTYSTNWANHISNLEKIENAPMGYTFWYIDGVYNRTNNVLKASLDSDFEDSTGTRYTYQAVSGLIKPINREDVRKHFEEAEHYGCLLKYYSTVDEFTMSKY
ncbi:hypothetical protein, partial [Staphylococcus phage Stab23]